MDAVHSCVVEFLRKVCVEDRFFRLQRHPLVHKRSAAHTGCADRCHVLARHRLQQACIGLEDHRPTEQSRVGLMPEDALVRAGGMRKSFGIRSGLPPNPSLQQGDRNPCLGQAKSRDPAAESRSHDDDTVFLTGQRNPCCSLGSAWRRHRDSHGSRTGQK